MTKKHKGIKHFNRSQNFEMASQMTERKNKIRPAVNMELTGSVSEETPLLCKNKKRVASCTAHTEVPTMVLNRTNSTGSAEGTTDNAPRSSKNKNKKLSRPSDDVKEQDPKLHKKTKLSGPANVVDQVEKAGANVKNDVSDPSKRRYTHKRQKDSDKEINEHSVKVCKHKKQKGPTVTIAVDALQQNENKKQKGSAKQISEDIVGVRKCKKHKTSVDDVTEQVQTKNPQSFSEDIEQAAKVVKQKKKPESVSDDTAHVITQKSKNKKKAIISEDVRTVPQNKNKDEQNLTQLSEENSQLPTKKKEKGKKNVSGAKEVCINKKLTELLNIATEQKLLTLEDMKITEIAKNKKGELSSSDKNLDSLTDLDIAIPSGSKNKMVPYRVQEFKNLAFINDDDKSEEPSDIAIITLTSPKRDMKFLNELYSTWIRNPFDKEELELADEITFHALAMFQSRITVTSIGLDQIFPDPKGCFKRLLKFVTITLPELNYVLCGLRKHLEGEIAKGIKRERSRRNRTNRMVRRGHLTRL